MQYGTRQAWFAASADGFTIVEALADDAGHQAALIAGLCHAGRGWNRHIEVHHGGPSRSTRRAKRHAVPDRTTAMSGEHESAWEFVDASPRRQVVINEVLTHTDPPLEDAIEILNTNAVSVNITGWFEQSSVGTEDRS